MAGQCCFRYSGNCWTVIPSIPALPLLALTRANACLQFLRSQTSSINCSLLAGLSASRFATNDSVPSAESLGASLLLISVKASSSWFFCRLSLMSCAAYLPLPLTPANRGPFGPSSLACLLCPLLTSAARSTASLNLSRDFHDTQQISRGKFDRLPRTTAGFTTSVLDGYGLRCQLPTRPTPYASYPVLVHRLAPLLHASFRPRLATTPLRFANTSPPSGCVEDFHLLAVEHARHTIDIGRLSPAFPVTPPYVRVRIRRFRELSQGPEVRSSFRR